MRRCSSVVEQLIRNQQVVGSSPTIGSSGIKGLWVFPETFYILKVPIWCRDNLKGTHRCLVQLNDIIQFRGNLMLSLG